MQNQPRYSLMRRLLFPYSGEEVLTRKQGLRVIVVWAVFFSFAISFCSLPVIGIFGVVSFYKLGLLLLAAFLSGVVIFGALAWVVVIMNNQAAQFRQRQDATKTSGTNGGRYGS